MARQWDTLALAVGELWWRNRWGCTWLIPEGWRCWEALWWGPVEYVGLIRYERVLQYWGEEAFVFLAN